MNWKKWSVVFFIALLFTVQIQSVLAYLSAKTEEKVNTMTPATYSCEVVETYSGYVKENVRIKNTGTQKAFVRVKLLPYWYGKNENVIVAKAAWTPEFEIGDGWFYAEGYYYYKYLVEPNSETAPLIHTISLEQDDVSLCRQVLEIAAQCVQADGQTIDQNRVAQMVWDMPA